MSKVHGCASVGGSTRPPRVATSSGGAPVVEGSGGGRGGRPIARSCHPSRPCRTQHGVTTATTTASAPFPYLDRLLWRRRSRLTLGAWPRFWASGGSRWFVHQRILKWAGYVGPFSATDVGSRWLLRCTIDIRRASTFRVQNTEIESISD
jgi:hypothetical protein